MSAEALSWWILAEWLCVLGGRPSLTRAVLRKVGKSLYTDVASLPMRRVRQSTSSKFGDHSPPPTPLALAKLCVVVSSYSDLDCVSARYVGGNLRARRARYAILRIERAVDDVISNGRFALSDDGGASRDHVFGACAASCKYCVSNRNLSPPRLVPAISSVERSRESLSESGKPCFPSMSEINEE